MDATNRHHHDPRIRHETSDVNVWAVGKFGIGLVIVTILSFALLLGLFRYFESREEANKGTTVEVMKAFPEPRLETNEPRDLKGIRDEEDKVLKSYSWVDQQKGIVRIPVDVAIDVLAKRGLPSRAGTPAPADSVLNAPASAPAAPKESAHEHPAEERKK